MKWTFNNDRPIASQIEQQLITGIISGEYPPGSRLASVRELAADAKVNPNTMQKALSELERSGLIYTVRTSGRFVTEDVGMIENMKKDKIMEKIRTFIIEMKAMGLNNEEILEFIKRSEDELK